jgi:hypothetical protein
MDKLIIEGLGRIDGEYDVDLGEVLAVGGPDSLTNRELHRIKVMTGLRAGELEDAFFAYDNDVVVALASVLLTRRGKSVDEDVLWDAPAGSALRLVIGDREQAKGDADPPAEPAETPETEQPSPSGGESSSLTLAHPVTDRSRTGLHDSVMSVTSSQAT